MVSPNHARALYEALWPESICAVGRGFGMTSCRMSLGLAHDLLVSNVMGMVMRIFLFWQRERRRPSSSREEVSRRRT
jgi:hypothetical protein